MIMLMRGRSQKNQKNQKNQKAQAQLAAHLPGEPVDVAACGRIGGESGEAAGVCQFPRMQNVSVDAKSKDHTGSITTNDMETRLKDSKKTGKTEDWD